jgi:hypothetical protein
MKKTPEELIKKQGEAEGEHSRFRQMYDDVYKFGMPGRYNAITEVDTNGQKNREVLFSSVLEQACDEFVQRFQSLVCPVNSNWIDFEAGYMYQKDNSNTETVNKELSKVADVLNVFKATSNYDTAFTEASYDLIPGTACLCLLEGTPDNPFRFSAIPFVDLYMCEGLSGDIDTYFRKMKIKNYLVKQQWKDAKFEYEDKKDDECADLIECTYYDYDIKQWHYVVIDVSKKKFIIERIYKCSPFIDLRWAKCAGETYGRGPGLKVIADFKTLNRIKEYSLRALAFTVPTFTVSTDNGFDPSKTKLLPGALNPVPTNATNNPTIAPLQINPMPELRNYNAEQLEMDIKRAMFASTIPNDPSRELTATEVARRVQELDNSLNNSFGRLLEFLYRLSQRMVEVAQRFGYLQDDLDVRSFNGYGFKVKVNTQLANQQSKQEVSDMLQSLQIMAQFDPEMSYTSKVLNMNEMIPYVLDRMGVPNKFIRTPEEIEALEQQEGQAIAQAQANAAQMDVDVANAKEQGKVNAQRQL